MSAGALMELHAVQGPKPVEKENLKSDVWTAGIQLALAAP